MLLSIGGLGGSLGFFVLVGLLVCGSAPGSDPDADRVAGLAPGSAGPSPASLVEEVSSRTPGCPCKGLAITGNGRSIAITRSHLFMIRPPRLPVCALVPFLQSLLQRSIGVVIRLRSRRIICGSTRDTFLRLLRRRQGAQLRTFRSKLQIEIAKVSMNIPELWMTV